MAVGDIIPSKSKSAPIPCAAGNSWFQKLILGQLEEIKNQVENLSETQMRMREDIVRLKMQSSVWGFAAGCIPILIALFLYAIKAFAF
jgi:hypothetical protein